MFKFKQCRYFLQNTGFNRINKGNQFTKYDLSNFSLFFFVFQPLMFYQMRSFRKANELLL